MEWNAVLKVSRRRDGEIFWERARAPRRQLAAHMLQARQASSELLGPLETSDRPPCLLGGTETTFDF